jgi:hypothetical protein
VHASSKISPALIAVALAGKRSTVTNPATQLGPAILMVDARTRFKGLYVDVAGRLTKGMYAPVGLWVDRFGNLYVANADGHDVTEYSPCKKSPKCTYT